MANNKPPNRSIPLLIMVLGGLLVLIVAVYYGWQLAQPAPVPTPAQVENTEQVARVSLENAKAAFDQQTAIFVDVRDADSYAASHIPGALSIPLNELPNRLNELDPNAWIITYCT